MAIKPTITGDKMRMTKQSKANLMVSDEIKIVSNDLGFLVLLYRGGNCVTLSDSSGPIVYSDKKVARRTVRRFRPDLEPVEI
jgi:hypothetical protein